MRLFIGIDLPQSMKSYLFNVSKSIERHTQGRVTALNNYHLTLAFLGELDDNQTNALKSLMSQIQFYAFEMTLSDVDYFQKGERFIYYMGIKPNPSLKTLYQKVLDVISPFGLSIHGKFSPHITLIRQGKSFPIHVLTIPKTDDIIQVQKVTLFLSHQINDELTYTPIYEVLLQTNKRT
jgi:RNA 2',3'-cyclic 3'-phosphodiesterase